MWSRSLNLAKVNDEPKGSDDRRKVDVVKRLVSQTVKVVNQRETLASRTVKLADPRPIAPRHARPKGIVNLKLVAKVTDVRQKEDAHPKETDVVRAAMLVVALAMVHGVVSCRVSLKFSTAITMARSAAMNWIA